MKSIQVIPTGTLNTESPTPADIVITQNDGTSSTFPVLFPENMFKVITQYPDMSDYVKNSSITALLKEINRQISQNNAQIQNQINNLPAPPDLTAYATKDSLNAEISARTNSSNTLQENVDTLNNAQAGLQTKLNNTDANLTNETTRAQSTEQTLQNSITQISNSYVSGTSDVVGGVSVKSLSFDTAGNIIVEDRSGNKTNIAKSTDLNTMTSGMKDQINIILNQSLQDSQTKTNERIDTLTKNIIDGNNELTTTVKSLLQEGVQNEAEIGSLGSNLKQEILDRQTGDQTTKDQLDTELKNAVNTLNTTISNNNNSCISDNQSTNKVLYQEITDRKNDTTNLTSQITSLSTNVQNSYLPLDSGSKAQILTGQSPLKVDYPQVNFTNSVSVPDPRTFTGNSGEVATTRWVQNFLINEQASASQASAQNITISGLPASESPLIQCFRWSVKVSTSGTVPTQFTIPFPIAFSGIPYVTFGNGTAGDPEAALNYDGTTLTPQVTNSSVTVNYGVYSTPGSVTNSSGQSVSPPSNFMVFGIDIIAIGPK